MIRFRSLAILAAVGPCILAGCLSEAGPAASVSGWSRDRYEDVSYAAAFNAAQYAAGQWFGIAEAPPQSGRITTTASEADERGGAERLRDVVRAHNTIRRQATLRVVNQPKEHLVVIECVVTRQRLDTNDARAMAQQSGYESAPGRAPLPAETGASDAQREVWTDIGRDRGLERQILDVARDRLRREARPAASRP